MPICLYIPVTGNASEVLFKPKELPDITNEFKPEPFLLNVFYKKGCQRHTALLKSERLQWSHMSPFPGLRILFQAPEVWSLPGLQELGWKNVNKTATYLCKHHEVFGPAVVFSAEGKDLSLKDYDGMLKEAQPKLHDSETGEIKSFSANRENAPLTLEERRNVRVTYARDMCDRRNLLSLELMYLLLNPMIEKQYVIDGKAFYNSLPSYAISDNMIDSYIMIRFESGVVAADDADYIYMTPTEYPMIRTDNYTEVVAKMKEVMKKTGLEYIQPIPTVEEEAWLNNPERIKQRKMRLAAKKL